MRSSPDGWPGGAVGWLGVRLASWARVPILTWAV